MEEIYLNKTVPIGLLTFLSAIMITASVGLVMGIAEFTSDGNTASPLSLGGFEIQGPYFIIGTFFSIINMILSLILLAIYLGYYRQAKAEFNLVLVIVAVTLFCYSFVANPLLHVAFGFAGSFAEAGLGSFFLLPDLFIFGTLIALLYLSLKY